MPLPQQFEQPETKIPETKSSPEIKPGDQEAAPEHRPVEQPSTSEQSAPTVSPSTPTLAASPAEQMTKDIEAILEDNIADVYRSLPPAKQKEFLRIGETTARKISTMMQTASVKVRKVLSLIRQWLKVIPGVNSFFLEQEAKIKSDRIMELYRRRGGSS